MTTESPPPATLALLEGFPVHVRLPVQWGDQDAFGHVNNTVYLRWFETARIAYSDRAGLLQIDQSQKLAPILAAVSCNYRRQIRFPDTVWVGARVSKLGRTSLTMQHRVVSERQELIAAEGDCVVVTFDYQQQKPVPVPEELRLALRRLEGPTLENRPSSPKTPSE
jgi:acyl-CoA thioester hydrolase